MRGIFFLTSFILILSADHLLSDNIPVFSIKDQYENRITNKNLIGQPSILIGCERDDLELCRKIGRKIFWKMQNLLWKDSNKVNFIAYLNLTETNPLIEKFIADSKQKNFESIYLDRNGDLKDGLKSDHVFLRLYNAKGLEKSKDYLASINNDKIKEIYEIIKIDIK
jgi:hypothetical protein